MKGGLTAVIWTDFIQTILMLIGAIILAALGTPIQYFYIIKLFAHVCTCIYIYISAIAGQTAGPNGLHFFVGTLEYPRVTKD